MGIDIVMLAGAAGSGKSYVREHMEHLSSIDGGKQLSTLFADPLKKIAYNLLSCGVNEESAYTSIYSHKERLFKEPLVLRWPAVLSEFCGLLGDLTTKREKLRVSSYSLPSHRDLLSGPGKPTAGLVDRLIDTLGKQPRIQSGRTLLQFLGTEVGRRVFHTNLWGDAWFINTLTEVKRVESDGGGYTHITVDDARFDTEYHTAKHLADYLGGRAVTTKMVKLDENGEEVIIPGASSHESERVPPPPWGDFDHTFMVREGDTDGLRDAARTLVGKVLKST